MSHRSLAGFIRGCVRVQVMGKNPERFVNLCLGSAIPIWDIRAVDGKVYLTMFLNDYFKVRPIARKARCTARVRSRNGLPFFLGRINRRKAFLSAFFLAFLFFIYLSGSVWAIRFKGLGDLDESRVLEVARSYGLRKGARKSALDPHKIEAGLLKEIPNLSWVYVRFQGSLASIEMVKKVVPEEEGPGDIVAAKDGVVTSVLVLRGIPLVDVGETVKKGEILIAGDAQSGVGGARGSVMASTWYRMYKEIPLKQLIATRTGESMGATMVRYGGREYVMARLFKSIFDWYEVEEYPGFQVVLPYLGKLSTSRLRMYEIRLEERLIDNDKAWETAEKEALESLRRQLPSSAELIDLSYEVRALSDSLLGYEFLASVSEEIGVLQAWPVHDSGVDR